MLTVHVTLPDGTHLELQTSPDAADYNLAEFGKAIKLIAALHGLSADVVLSHTNARLHRDLSDSDTRS